VKVAVVQIGSTFLDTPATLGRTVAAIEAAAAEGAELAVLPEALLGGYPKGLDFGVTVGVRSSEGRDEFRRYWEAAIDVPGPESEELREVARANGIAIVIGVVARVGHTLIARALLFDTAGSAPLVHDKLMPTAGERTIWGGGDGSTMPLMEHAGARLGSGICWEHYMPLFRTAMYAKGVDVWCAVTVDDRDVWEATMRHVALEGRCFVLSACQYLTRGDLPDDLHPILGEDPATKLIAGGSVIVSPLGEVLTGPLRDEEGILFADLDLADLARARMDFDAVGHYARPDIFQLLVDESSRTPVSFHNARSPVAATGLRDVDRRAPRPVQQNGPRIDPVR
jgi:nitrilase